MHEVHDLQTADPSGLAFWFCFDYQGFALAWGNNGPLALRAATPPGSICYYVLFPRVAARPGANGRHPFRMVARRSRSALPSGAVPR